MRFLVTCFAFAMVQTVAFGQASNRCLEDATNRQLVNELERRLYLDDGEEAGAVANFFCDSNTYLSISLINQSGQESTERIYIGNESVCRNTLAELRSIGRIQNLVIVAVCDLNTYLHRYTLSPNGTLSQLDRRYIGNMTTCVEERTDINTRNKQG